MPLHSRRLDPPSYRRSRSDASFTKIGRRSRYFRSVGPDHLYETKGRHPELNQAIFDQHRSTGDSHSETGNEERSSQYEQTTTDTDPIDDTDTLTFDTSALYDTPKISTEMEPHFDSRTSRKTYSTNMSGTHDMSNSLNTSEIVSSLSMEQESLAPHEARLPTPHQDKLHTVDNLYRRRHENASQGSSDESIDRYRHDSPGK